MDFSSFTKSAKLWKNQKKLEKKMWENFGKNYEKISIKISKNLMPDPIFLKQKVEFNTSFFKTQN